MKAGRLEQLDENVYYLADGVNIGIIRIADGECAVIDTGASDDSGMRVAAAAESLGLKITTILNTHSHVDHFGGNAYLVDRFGALVYAPSFESELMAEPIIGPIALFGAEPLPELFGRRVAPKPSYSDHVIGDGQVDLGSQRLKVIPLPGHSTGQRGFIAESVCFPGDALFSEEAWRKLILLYVADVGKALDSLERLRTVGAREFVPSHTQPTSDVNQLIDVNVERIQGLADEILHEIATPVTAEEVLKIIADRHALSIGDLRRYYLCLSTVKAYLAYLTKKEVARYFLDANRLFWVGTE